MLWSQLFIVPIVKRKDDRAHFTLPELPFTNNRQSVIIEPGKYIKELAHVPPFKWV